MKYDYLIVGAGLAGSTAAERLASVYNKRVLIVEKRNHIGGNAYDEYDEYEILLHKYGPHIFHTNSKVVFDYLSKFTEWQPYEHKVLALHGGKYYPIPINITTLNKLYRLNIKTEEEAKEYYKSVRITTQHIRNSEDIIVNKIGKDLFERFFKNFTIKQWGLEPKDLDPSVCGRIPVRTNADDRYFTDKYQFMPKYGYTKMFERMLDHSNIDILLNTDYKDVINNYEYRKMIYTGPIDYFFNYKFGKLGYRSIDFTYKHYEKKEYQPVAQVNHVDLSSKYTRVVEHKKLNGSVGRGTTVSFEIPKQDGDPFYPIPNPVNRKIYSLYKAEAEKLENVIFIGRLAEYKYYNMDQVVANTLNIIKNINE